MAGEDRSGRSVGDYKGKLEEITSTSGDLQKAQGSGQKAILFVPEGFDVTGSDLDIEVVAIDPATFEAMGPRRT